MIHYIHPSIIQLRKRLEDKNFLSRAKSLVEEIILAPVTIGLEVEFYLSEGKALINERKYHFQKERGKNQYEFHLGPTDNLEEIQNLLINSMKEIKADFSPKPYIDDFGSSVQYQISSNSEIFQKNIEKIAAYFCYYANETFLAYCHTEEDFARFDSRFMAPTHICYGFNNRTCLIRINGETQKRIEIRSPSSNSDSYVILATILATLYKSLSLNINVSKHKKIFGNAFDNQYNLELIPANLKKAYEKFNPAFYDNF